MFSGDKVANVNTYGPAILFSGQPTIMHAQAMRSNSYKFLTIY